MNAPETLKPTTAPINLAHEVLLKADEALCVEEVARAILGGDKPTKGCIKDAAKQLKKLADLGMIEMEPRAGGVPFYRLIAAPQMGGIPLVEQKQEVEKAGPADIPPPQYDPASVAFPPSVVTRDPHTGMPRNPLDIESDPRGLLIVKDGEPLKAASKAERVLTPEAHDDRDDFEALYGDNGDCSCHVSAPCGSCTHPGNPRNQENNDACWMAAGDSEGGETDAPAWATDPALQYLAPEDYEMPPADPVLLAMANRMLGDRLDGVAHVLRGCGLPLLADASGAEDLQPKVAALAGAYQMALADLRSHEACLEAKDAELLAQAKAVIDLRDRLDALTQQWEADTGRITADLQAALKSRSQAINEADRLRGELAAERQAREALQEQSDAVDVKDAAVGYLIRVTKRKQKPARVATPPRDGYDGRAGSLNTPGK